MKATSPVIAVLTTLLIASVATADESTPRDVTLSEETQRELLQIDLTIDGPAHLVSQLGLSDFSVRINRKPVEIVAVDRICSGSVPTLEDATRGTRRPDTEGGQPTPQRSFLFYFDQHFLTPEGRERAITLAKTLVPLLITEGTRGMIVSTGQKLRVLTEWTAEPVVLLEGLERLREDPLLRDEYPGQEDLRLLQLQSAQQLSADVAAVYRFKPKAVLTGGGSVAEEQALDRTMRAQLDVKSQVRGSLGMYQRQFQLEEQQRASFALSRLSAIFGWMIPVESPKAMIYFADTMRANPGDHYVNLYRPAHSALGSCGPGNPFCHVNIGSSLPAYQRVIDEALTHGVRLYTVQARGLFVESGPIVASRSNQAMMSGPDATAQRFVDAKNALVGFAVETGAQAFLNGVGAEEIARRVDRDLSCVHLVNVDPKGLRRDRRLRLRVEVGTPGVTLRARTHVILQSDRTRRRSRVETAAFRPTTTERGDPMRVIVIPTGFSSKSYSGLVQVVLPPGELSGHTWDVGLTLVPERGKRRQLSGRVGVSHSGVPIVFERVVEFPPGEYELHVVAQQVGSGSVLSRRTQGRWPATDPESLTIGSCVVLQPARAAFVRDGEVRRVGSLAKEDGERVEPSWPTAVFGIVCRGREEWPDGSTVVRRLVGADTAEFEPVRPDAGDRCVLFRDLIPQGTLTSGVFYYEVEARDAMGTVSRLRHRFTAVSSDELMAVGDLH